MKRRRAGVTCLTLTLLLRLLHRSQDKGFHVDKALLHVLTRSAPYVQAQLVKMEEVVGEEKVQYNVPAELHEYLFRYS